MSYNEDIKKKIQFIARTEQQLAIEKLKNRRADTRNKIQLGGLVIKSEMSIYSKEIILGSLLHAFKMIQEDENYITLFSSIGQNAFMDNKTNG
tara:strand:+ start:351 stop:629 length:279 start_codon:yes stop_codon:yes gene_type:complete